jgi:iron complex outermembrane recepter protein
MRSASKPLERPSIHPRCPAILLALVLAAAWAESATAQIEEVTVTARRRSEAIQEVPESITAFVADQIENRQMRVIDDVLATTSNVHIVNDQDTATNIITVRGIGTNRNLAASVAFVIDGVVLPDTDAFVQDLTDVERIEVLKGPQGALYGKNAIGGAINVTTKRPTTDFEAELKAGYGNGESVNLFGAVSGPIVGEKVLARFTAQYRDSDGFIRNDFDGELLDRNESERATLRVLLQPTERLSVDMRGSYLIRTPAPPGTPVSTFSARRAARSPTRSCA